MIIERYSKLLIICILLLCFLSYSCFSSETNFTKLDSILSNYDKYVKEIINDKGVPGVAIAIVINNQIEFIKGYGVKKIEEKDSIGIHTVFRLASVSKGFASILTGLLVNDSTLSWNDKVIKYLPDFNLKDTTTTKNLTIQHILNHTSGLMPHAYDNLIEANLPFSTIIERLKEVSVHCSVGECYGYQNTVYSLISEVIKSATKKNYVELLKKKLIQPLGMKDVSFSKKDMLESKNLTYPHVRRHGNWKSTELRDSYYNVPPAAGVNASIYDMAYWLKALLGGTPKVLSQKIIQEVSKPLINTPREKYRFNWKNRLKYAAYGLGWRIFDYAGYTMIYHSGGLRGYYSQLAFLPKEKIGIVVLQNAQTGNGFVNKFVDLYFNLDQY